MASLKELLQEFVNMDYSELLGIAQSSLSDVLPVFNQIADDGEGIGLVIPFICTSLAVDGKFTELEYKFLCDLIGNIDYATARDAVQSSYNDESINLVDQVIDSCPDDLKATLLTFCTAFLAVDETISREEVAFITKLIG
ncbi:MAG: hypothetical protein J6R42_05515 [Clostridia bacterium]|nr:hypothetical protein [Clostridia bacterium]